MKLDYEMDEKFRDKNYQIGKCDVAWYVLGWEIESDEDTEWTGIKTRTGNIVAVMVGDDRHFSYEPDMLKEIPDEEFCSGCGQIGCGHNK